jgi:cardiolipin synthase
MKPATLARASATLLMAALVGCSTLPKLEEVEPYAGSEQPARIVTASRVLSEEQSKAIVERLKAQAGDTDILGRHVAISEAISKSPLVAGNRTLLLEDGPATYAAMQASIRGATRSINFATYIFEADDTGKQFAALFAEKRRQGVEVNVIYDSVGSIKTPKEFFEGMRAAGIRVVEFNPVNPLNAKRGWRINNRSHRKLMIVDDTTVFIGGINISDVYSGGSFGSGVPSGGPGGSRGNDKAQAAAGNWRDTHLQIEGPVATEFQKIFLESWHKQKGEPIAADKPVGSALPQGAAPSKGGHLVRAIASTPDQRRNEMYLTLLSAVTYAERNIYITTAYLAPDRELKEALQAAVKRGVDVKLLLSSVSDSWLAFNAGRAHYSDLLRDGVKIYERRGPLMHAKSVTIDGVWSSVGSTNIDWRSLLHNDEADAAILGREFALQMEAMFARDLAQSDEITAETWARRSPAQRLREGAARMWEYML